MKRLSLFVASCVLALAACTNMPGTTPAQAAVNTTAEACKGVVAAMKAATSAIQANVLKGSNADTAIKGLEAAQVGCRSSLLAIQAANAAAASGASK
jgi:hypothetical protein